MAVALAVLDAHIESLAANGATRGVAIARFHRLPGDTPHIETVLKSGEMIRRVALPPPPPGRQLYRKVRDRASYAFALVSVAVIVQDGAGNDRCGARCVRRRCPQTVALARGESVLVGQPATMAAYWGSRRGSDGGTPSAAATNNFNDRAGEAHAVSRPRGRSGELTWRR